MLPNGTWRIDAVKYVSVLKSVVFYPRPSRSRPDHTTVLILFSISSIPCRAELLPPLYRPTRSNNAYRSWFDRSFVFRLPAAAGAVDLARNWWPKNGTRRRRSGRIGKKVHIGSRAQQKVMCIESALAVCPSVAILWCRTYLFVPSKILLYHECQSPIWPGGFSMFPPLIN